MVTFLRIETFKVFRKVVGGATTEITDSFLVNLLRKYFVFVESGNEFLDDETEEVFGFRTVFENSHEYNESLTDAQETASSNPLMLTVEEVEDDPIGAPGVKSEHLIGYVLDFVVDSKFISSGVTDDLIPKNPLVLNDGNNLIKQLDGGKIDDTDVGLTWPILIEDGDALGPEGQVTTFPPLVDEYPLFGEELDEVLTIPAPFLLFDAADIS